MQCGGRDCGTDDPWIMSGEECVVVDNPQTAVGNDHPVDGGLFLHKSIILDLPDLGIKPLPRDIAC